MTFFFVYLSIGVFATCWLWMSGTHIDALMQSKSRGIQGDIPDETFENIALLSTCIVGLLLWPVLVVEILMKNYV